MRLFRWLSAEVIPNAVDLRRCGWLDAGAEAFGDEAAGSPALAFAGSIAAAYGEEIGEWRFPPLRSLVLLIGVDDSDQRAQLLRLGFGDVLDMKACLREVEARALRIAARAAALPRLRQFGALRLDLFARDGFVGERPLGLHPREFALIWRLSDTPGTPVAKKQLVRDVWRMAHVPDTNSLAVHVFRLRAKLAIAGLAALVQTAPSGGYFLAAASPGPGHSPFLLADADGQESKAMALSVEHSLPREPQS